jgi:hypothetical protein
LLGLQEVIQLLQIAISMIPRCRRSVVVSLTFRFEVIFLFFSFPEQWKTYSPITVRVHSAATSSPKYKKAFIGGGIVPQTASEYRATLDVRLFFDLLPLSCSRFLLFVSSL